MSHNHEEHHLGTARKAPKPAHWTKLSPNRSSRNGTPIRRVVLHYTTSRSLEGTVSWFMNPASQVSAHYVVGRDGSIVQMVPDNEKAWHAAAANTDSIGIEFSAAKGDALTAEQDKAGRALVRYLAEEYHLSVAAFSGHRFLASTTTGTDCPGSLWKSLGALQLWVASAIDDVVEDTPAPVPTDPKSTGRPYAPCPVPVPWAMTLGPTSSAIGLSTGEPIYHLQCALIGLGYLRGPAEPTTMVGDVFNEHVEWAVKGYQDTHNLEVDGVVGPKTRAALEASLRRVREKPAEPKPAGKPVRCVFAMDLEPSQALRAGTLTFLDAAGTVVRKEPATSGLPGYQTSTDVWTRGAGPVPAVPNQAIRFSAGYHLNTRGIEGWAFPMLPDPIMRNGAVGRSEIMLHRDANVPGTAGCIGLLLSKADYDAFVEWAKPLGTLPLEVKYT